MVPEQDSAIWEGVLEDTDGFQAGAVVELFSTADRTTPVNATVSDQDGYYALTVPMADGPFYGFVSYRLDGHKPHALHVPSGVYEDDGADLRIIDQAVYQGILGVLRVSELSDRPSIAVSLGDCSEEEPLRDAVVSITPSDGDTQVVYTGEDGNVLDVESTRRGNAWIFGVVPGDVNVTITYDDIEIVNYDLNVEADSYHTISTVPVRGG